MIYIAFFLSARPQHFKILWDKTWRVSTNKNFEIQVNRTSHLFGFCFNWHRGHHGGVELELALGTYEIEFRFIDGRHWDYENNCYES